MTFHPGLAVAFRYTFIAALGGFVIAGAINDAKDFLQAQRSNQPVPACAIVSILRPANCPRSRGSSVAASRM